MLVNNWRSAHSYPLNSINMTLKQRAIRVEKTAIVYQRLKRAEAIRAKMLRQEKEHGRMFDLTSMQDLGGCRAIMSDVDKIEELLSVYEDAHKKNPDRGSIREHMDDYISQPKDDGYRGVHLIYKYRSQAEEHALIAAREWDRLKFDGLRIEIQIRSRLQHQWASAVETAGRHIRRNIKGDGGGKSWENIWHYARRTE